MVRFFLAAFAALLVASCSTVGGHNQTPGQNLYAAHSAYNIVLERAVVYAESDGADPSIVATLNSVNQQIAPKIRYAHAFIACNNPGDGDVILLAARVSCGDFTFDTQTVLSNTEAIKQAADLLAGILRDKGIISWATPPSSFYAYSTSSYSHWPKAHRSYSSTANYGIRSISSSAKTGNLPTKNMPSYYGIPRIYQVA